MAITLASLVTRLQNMVPARDGVPADYEQIVKDAVLQVSQDVPAIRYAVLSIVPGVATYDLADDFIDMILMESAWNPDGIIISDAGLIPTSADYEEVYAIVNGQITITPTPTYTVDRDYKYIAGFVLDGDEIYQNLSQNTARIAMYYAQYTALNEIATSASGGNFSYTIGDERVDKKGMTAGYMAQADRMLTQYQNAIKPHQTGGIRARYNRRGL